MIRPKARPKRETSVAIRRDLLAIAREAMAREGRVMDTYDAIRARTGLARSSIMRAIKRLREEDALTTQLVYVGSTPRLRVTWVAPLKPELEQGAKR